jgi:hypothetical protein
VEQEYGVTGILYEVGSVYEGLCKLTDLRKAKGKQYALEMVLLIVVMAKLCGEDKPLGIAEWAQHRLTDEQVVLAREHDGLDDIFGRRAAGDQRGPAVDHGVPYLARFRVTGVIGG